MPWKCATDQEVLEDKIGFRQIETKGKESSAERKANFPSGISIHEEAPYRQRARVQQERIASFIELG